jgi:5'-nucleotidase
VVILSLDISRAAFRGGEDPWDFLEPFRCDLFLTAEAAAVKAGFQRRIPAA